MEDGKTSLMFSDLERVRCETIFDVTALTPARSCTLFDTDAWFRRFRIRFANPAGIATIPRCTCIMPSSTAATTPSTTQTITARAACPRFMLIWSENARRQCQCQGRVVDCPPPRHSGGGRLSSQPPDKRPRLRSRGFQLIINNKPMHGPLQCPMLSHEICSIG